MEPQVAEHEDVEFVFQLLRRIEREAVRKLDGYGGAIWVEHHVRETLHRAVQNPQGVVIYTGHAVLVLEIDTCPYHYGQRIARELFLRTDGRDGPAVLRAGEKWAVDVGATLMVFTANPELTERPESQARVYRRLGYNVLDVIWGKRLV